MLMISKLGVLSVVLACGAVSLVAIPAGHARRQSSTEGGISSLNAARMACAAVGATPGSLAAAGLSASEAESLLTWVTSDTEERTELVASQQALMKARSALTTAANSASNAPSDTSRQATLAQRTSDVQNAETRLGAARAAVIAEVDGVVGRSVCEVLGRMAEMARLGLPIEFGAASLSAADLRIARQAIKAESRANREGGTLSSEHSQTLSAIRAQSAVISATQALSTNVAQMTTLVSSAGLN